MILNGRIPCPRNFTELPSSTRSALSSSVASPGQGRGESRSGFFQGSSKNTWTLTINQQETFSHFHCSFTYFGRCEASGLLHLQHTLTWISQITQDCEIHWLSKSTCYMEPHEQALLPVRNQERCGVRKASKVKIRTKRAAEGYISTPHTEYIAKFRRSYPFELHCT